MRGLKHVLELINQDSSTNVAIVTSSVPGVYCTGADLKERKAFIAFEVREYSKALCAIFSFLKVYDIHLCVSFESCIDILLCLATHGLLVFGAQSMLFGEIMKCLTN